MWLESVEIDEIEMYFYLIHCLKRIDYRKNNNS